MNKTITLAAIAMVAVMMGISAFAPAAMGARDGPRGNATDAVCHLGGQATEELEDDLWFVLYVNPNAVAGHVEDGDTDIAETDEAAAECVARNEA